MTIEPIVKSSEPGEKIEKGGGDSQNPQGDMPEGIRALADAQAQYQTYRETVSAIDSGSSVNLETTDPRWKDALAQMQTQATVVAELGRTLEASSKTPEELGATIIKIMTDDVRGAVRAYLKGSCIVIDCENEIDYIQVATEPSTSFEPESHFYGRGQLRYQDEMIPVIAMLNRGSSVATDIEAQLTEYHLEPYRATPVQKAKGEISDLEDKSCAAIQQCFEDGSQEEAMLTSLNTYGDKVQIAWLNELGMRIACSKDIVYLNPKKIKAYFEPLESTVEDQSPEGQDAILKSVIKTNSERIQRIRDMSTNLDRAISAFRRVRKNDGDVLCELVGTMLMSAKTAEDVSAVETTIQTIRTITIIDTGTDGQSVALQIGNLRAGAPKELLSELDSLRTQWLIELDPIETLSGYSNDRTSGVDIISALHNALTRRNAFVEKYNLAIADFRRKVVEHKQIAEVREQISTDTPKPNRWRAGVSRLLRHRNQ